MLEAVNKVLESLIQTKDLENPASWGDVLQALAKLNNIYSKYKEKTIEYVVPAEYKPLLQKAAGNLTEEALDQYTKSIPAKNLRELLTVSFLIIAGRYLTSYLETENIFTTNGETNYQAAKQKLEKIAILIVNCRIELGYLNEQAKIQVVEDERPINLYEKITDLIKLNDHRKLVVYEILLPSAPTNKTSPTSTELVKKKPKKNFFNSLKSIFSSEKVALTDADKIADNKSVLISNSTAKPISSLPVTNSKRTFQFITLTKFDDELTGLITEAEIILQNIKIEKIDHEKISELFSRKYFELKNRIDNFYKESNQASVRPKNLDILEDNLKLIMMNYAVSAFTEANKLIKEYLNSSEYRAFARDVDTAKDSMNQESLNKLQVKILPKVHAIATALEVASTIKNVADMEIVFENNSGFIPILSSLKSNYIYEYNQFKRNIQLSLNAIKEEYEIIYKFLLIDDLETAKKRYRKIEQMLNSQDYNKEVKIEFPNKVSVNIQKLLVIDEIIFSEEDKSKLTIPEIMNFVASEIKAAEKMTVKNSQSDEQANIVVNPAESDSNIFGDSEDTYDFGLSNKQDTASSKRHLKRVADLNNTNQHPSPLQPVTIHVISEQSLIAFRYVAKQEFDNAVEILKTLLKQMQERGYNQFYREFFPQNFEVEILPAYLNTDGIEEKQVIFSQEVECDAVKILSVVLSRLVADAPTFVSDEFKQLAHGISGVRLDITQPNLSRLKAATLPLPATKSLSGQDAIPTFRLSSPYNNNASILENAVVSAPADKSDPLSFLKSLPPSSSLAITTQQSNSITNIAPTTGSQVQASANALKDVLKIIACSYQLENLEDQAEKLKDAKTRLKGSEKKIGERQLLDSNEKVNFPTKFDNSNFIDEKPQTVKEMLAFVKSTLEKQIQLVEAKLAKMNRVSDANLPVLKQLPRTESKIINTKKDDYANVVQALHAITLFFDGKEQDWQKIPEFVKKLANGYRKLDDDELNNEIKIGNLNSTVNHHVQQIVIKIAKESGQLLLNLLKAPAVLNEDLNLHVDPHYNLLSLIVESFPTIAAQKIVLKESGVNLEKAISEWQTSIITLRFEAKERQLSAEALAVGENSQNVMFSEVDKVKEKVADAFSGLKEGLFSLLAKK